MRQDVNDLAARFGLTKHREFIATLVRPAIEINVLPAPAGIADPRESRFGGLPHLPLDMAWPLGYSGPMTLLAMLRLSDVTRFDAAHALPRQGLLYFWYDVPTGAYGSDPEDHSGFAVTFEPDESAPLKLAQFPGDPAQIKVPAGCYGEPNPPSGAFRPCRLSFDVKISLPDRPTLETFWPHFAQDIDDESWWDLINAINSTGKPRHQLLGYPHVVQNAMEPECERVASRHIRGTTSNAPQTADAAHALGTHHWQVLLQLEADEDGPGWYWGDEGFLYYWIRKPDLTAASFEQCWQMLQWG